MARTWKIPGWMTAQIERGAAERRWAEIRNYGGTPSFIPIRWWRESDGTPFVALKVEGKEVVFDKDELFAWMRY